MIILKVASLLALCEPATAKANVTNGAAASSNDVMIDHADHAVANPGIVSRGRARRERRSQHVSNAKKRAIGKVGHVERSYRIDAVGALIADEVDNLRFVTSRSVGARLSGATHGDLTIEGAGTSSSSATTRREPIAITKNAPPNLGSATTRREIHADSNGMVIIPHSTPRGRARREKRSENDQKVIQGPRQAIVQRQDEALGDALRSYGIDARGKLVDMPADQKQIPGSMASEVLTKVRASELHSAGALIATHEGSARKAMASDENQVVGRSRNIGTGFFLGFGVGFFVFIVLLAELCSRGSPSVGKPQRRYSLRSAGRHESDSDGVQSSPVRFMAQRRTDSCENVSRRISLTIPVPSKQPKSEMHPKAGTKEVPTSSADLRCILEEKAGLDLSAWGKDGAKSVDDLYDEILKNQAELKWVTDSSGRLTLQRKVRVLQVKIFANTRNGPRYLKNCGVLDNLSKRHNDGKIRDLARKIGKREVPEDEITTLFWNELDLEPQWVKTHLVTDRTETQHFHGNDMFGASLPGLASRFAMEISWMRVKDVEADGVAGRLGLPNGDDFQTDEETLITSKCRHWKWTPAQDENPDSSRALSRASVSSFGETSADGASDTDTDSDADQQQQGG